MSQNGQTHFKNLAGKIFKVCLTILGYYAFRVNNFLVFNFPFLNFEQ